MVGEASTTWAGGLLHTQKRAGEAEGQQAQGSLPLRALNHHANTQVGALPTDPGPGASGSGGKGPWSSPSSPWVRRPSPAPACPYCCRSLAPFRNCGGGAGATAVPCQGCGTAAGTSLWAATCTMASSQRLVPGLASLHFWGQGECHISSKLPYGSHVHLPFPV